MRHFELIHIRNSQAHPCGMQVNTCSMLKKVAGLLNNTEYRWNPALLLCSINGGVGIPPFNLDYKKSRSVERDFASNSYFTVGFFQ